MSPRQAPRDMRIAPTLSSGVQPGPVQPRYALLINPFYPKDPHTSFGKHVLTPSLGADEHCGGHAPALAGPLLG